MSGLESIQIDLDGIGHALKDRTLSVPSYQRSYAWQEKHVNDLLQDLAGAIADGEKEYFLGSIVSMGTKNTPQQIVDGQQRLATTTILIAAVRDYFLEIGDSGRADVLETDYLATRDLQTMELLPKLKLNTADNDFFQKRIITRPNKRPAGLSPHRESHRLIAAAANMAAAHVKKLAGLTKDPAGYLVKWIGYLAQHTKVIWVLVPDEANAFTIFETLNDRGLDLAITDLLKNYLFGLSEDRIGEVQNCWMLMMGALEAIEGESLAVDYIRHLWSSKFGATRERDLYESIKKRITSKQAAVDFSNEFADNAKRYSALLNPAHEIWNQYGPTARQHIETINLLGMVQIRPLLLAVLDKFPVDQVRQTLRLMIAWGVRFLITGGLGGGTLESHYCQRAQEIRASKITNCNQLAAAMATVVPNDVAFRTAVETCSVSKAALARYYLRVIENQVRDQENPELVPNEDYNSLNLEHVLPQSPSADWVMDAEAAKANYKRLGNLTLIAADLNVAAGNTTFAAKKQIYVKSDLLITSTLSEYDKWDVAAIADRQKWLADVAVAAWPIN